MLKKRNRLSRRKFEYLLKHGRRVHGEGVTIVYVRAEIKDEREKIKDTPHPALSRGERDLVTTTYNLQPTTSSSLSTTYNLPPTTSRALRAGVVVGKKVARNAVDRNKLRRAIYRILGEVLVRGSVDQPPPPNLLTGAVHSSGLLHRSSQNTSTSLAPCPQHGSPLVREEGSSVGFLPLSRGGMRWGGSEGSETASLTQTLHIAILTRPKARAMTQEELRREIVTLLERCSDNT